ncbi:MAG: hypothetical protein ACON35_01705 [Candidatus Marinamargulisbacteria bacterium]
MIYPHHQKKVVAASHAPAKKQITIFLHQLIDNRRRLENEITVFRSKATATLEKNKNVKELLLEIRKKQNELKVTNQMLIQYQQSFIFDFSIQTTHIDPQIDGLTQPGKKLLIQEAALALTTHCINHLVETGQLPKKDDLISYAKIQLNSYLQNTNKILKGFPKKLKEIKQLKRLIKRNKQFLNSIISDALRYIYQLNTMPAVMQHLNTKTPPIIFTPFMVLSDSQNLIKFLNFLNNKNSAFSKMIVEYPLLDGISPTFHAALQFDLEKLLICLKYDWTPFSSKLNRTSIRLHFNKTNHPNNYFTDALKLVLQFCFGAPTIAGRLTDDAIKNAIITFLCNKIAMTGKRIEDVKRTDEFKDFEGFLDELFSAESNRGIISTFNQRITSEIAASRTSDSNQLALNTQLIPSNIQSLYAGSVLVDIAQMVLKRKKVRHVNHLDFKPSNHLSISSFVAELPNPDFFWDLSISLLERRAEFEDSFRCFKPNEEIIELFKPQTEDGGNPSQLLTQLLCAVANAFSKQPMAYKETMIDKFNQFLRLLRAQPEFQPILNPEEAEEPLTDPLAGIAWLAIKSGSYSSALFILNYLNENGSESVYKFLKEKLEQPLVGGKNMYLSSAFSFAVYCDISFWYLSNQYLRMPTKKEAIVNEITTLANTTKFPMLIIDFLESIQYSLHQNQQIKKLTKDDIQLWTAPVLTSFPHLNRTILHHKFEPMLAKAHYEDLMRPIKENAATSIQRIGRQYLSTKQSSAVSIQRIIRGHLGIKRRKQRYQSIIRIQSVLRMKQHRTIYLDCINKRTNASIKIQAMARAKHNYHWYKKHRISSIKLQAFLRMAKTKKTLIKHQNTATKIQAFQRMTTAKCSFKTHRNAATKIQAFQRMRAAKKAVNAQRDTIKKQNAAARKVQAFQRMRAAKKTVNALHDTIKKQNAAATKIQAFQPMVTTRQAYLQKQANTRYKQLIDLVSKVKSQTWFETYFLQNKEIVINGVCENINGERYIIDGTVGMTTTVNGTPQFVIISIDLNQKQIQISWGLNHKMQYNEPEDINNFLGNAKINYNYIEFNEPKFDGTKLTNTGLGIHLDQLCAAAIHCPPTCFDLNQD